MAPVESELAILPSSVRDLQALQPRALDTDAGAFTSKEVARHCSVDDGWIVVNGVVFDITAFAKTHPGFHGGGAGKVSTAIAIAMALGTDATEEFADFHQHTFMWKQLASFRIGLLREKEEEEGEEERGDVGDHPVPDWLHQQVATNGNSFEEVYNSPVPLHLVEYIADYKKAIERAGGIHSTTTDEKSASNSSTTDSTHHHRRWLRSLLRVFRRPVCFLTRGGNRSEAA